MINTERDIPQDVLMRIDLTGGTTIEYASQEGLSYDGAKSRVTRARRRLKQALLRDCEITLDARGKPIECRPKATDCCAPASGD